ncbi:AEC family transporter [Xylophilus sp.]|uniref:AEC family transporter n=1 Tax=Xylophilus sp. TaxID=2653893 RepID=UPI0013B81E5D|nr:AEC family transporter [Xylophilus sp.]KAF1044926.1 MAG: hypothetical protein GAK38_03277 [Xylophilus sp.]
MNAAVFSSLFPVVFFISLGYASVRLGWVGRQSVRDISNIVFLVLSPALLFRTMSTVHPEDLDFGPVLVYFIAALAIFTVVILAHGFNRAGAVMALAGTFSNTVMIGVPLVGLAFGKAGLTMLFTLVSVHSLILLTLVTVVLELATAREAARRGEAQRGIAVTVLKAVRNGILHPVPLPIVAGMLFAQTGWTLPPVLDQSLQMLGVGLGPMALLVVGITLAFTPIGTHLRGALGLSAIKTVLHPLAVLALGWAMGLSGLPLGVMVVTAALPIGANVFLFSQRYAAAEEVVTASVAVSTIAGLVTVPLALAIATRV